MNYLRIKDKKYPYTFDDLCRDYPHVSFPVEMTGVNMSDFGLAEVTTIIPDYEASTHYLKANKPKKIKGEWIVKYRPVKFKYKTPEKEKIAPDWDGFNLYWSTDPTRIQYDKIVTENNPALCNKLDLAYLMIPTQGTANFSNLFELYCKIAEVSQANRKTWAKESVNYALPETVKQIIYAHL